MNTTNKPYDKAIESCRDIFIKKTNDYGTSWRVLRTISIVDQIYIKAKRIRTIQEKRLQKIGDDILSEFKGMLNYAVIGIIQLEQGNDKVEDMVVEEAIKLYDDTIAKAKALMLDKNHDYGEAWRDMSQESFVDLILSKLLRIRQIISNDGKTIMSEGIDANYFDIINYAAFALILIAEGKHSTV
jgi:Nucleotide modification associated domain 1